MTEDEAKTKWCPFVRVLLDTPDLKGTGNRLSSLEADLDNPVQARCIASDCMAWRWIGPPRDQPRHGVCGLAGKS